jgi:hypothetical protein
MLLLPAMRESRDATRRLVCESNLQTLGTGLYEYQENHGGWLPPVMPGAPAGQYVMALADHVGMDRDELARLIVCPDSELANQISRGEVAIQIPTHESFERLPPERRLVVWSSLGGSYAFRVGYRDELRDYRHVKYTGRQDQPMLSDVPSLSHSGVRSFNHGNNGQNVLDESLRVRYRINSDLATSVDNIYLNMEGRHDAGCTKDDIVLLRADHGLGGPVLLLEFAR